MINCSLHNPESAHCDHYQPENADSFSLVTLGETGGGTVEIYLFSLEEAEKLEKAAIEAANHFRAKEAAK